MPCLPAGRAAQTSKSWGRRRRAGRTGTGTALHLHAAMAGVGGDKAADGQLSWREDSSANVRTHTLTHYYQVQPCTPAAAYSDEE